MYVCMCFVYRKSLFRCKQRYRGGSRRRIGRLRNSHILHVKTRHVENLINSCHPCLLWKIWNCGDNMSSSCLSTLPGLGPGSREGEHRFIHGASQERESNRHPGQRAPLYPRGLFRQPGWGAAQQTGAAGCTAQLEEWRAEQTGWHAGQCLFLEGNECEAECTYFSAKLDL